MSVHKICADKEVFGAGKVEELKFFLGTCRFLVREGRNQESHGRRKRFVVTFNGIIRTSSSSFYPAKKRREKTPLSLNGKKRHNPCCAKKF